MERRWFECESGAMLDMNSVVAFRLNVGSADTYGIIAETTGSQGIVVGKLVRHETSVKMCRILATNESLLSWVEATAVLRSE